MYLYKSQNGLYLYRHSSPRYERVILSILLGVVLGLIVWFIAFTVLEAFTDYNASGNVQLYVPIGFAVAFFSFGFTSGIILSSELSLVDYDFLNTEEWQNKLAAYPQRGEFTRLRGKTGRKLKNEISSYAFSSYVEDFSDELSSSLL